MAILYWSCPDSAVDVLLAELDALGRGSIAMDRRNGLSVLSIVDPDEELVVNTLAMITSGLLTSGALVQRRLAQDNLWIAAEWWERLLIEKPLLSMANFSAHDQFSAVEAGGRHFVVVPARRKVEPEPVASEQQPTSPGEPMSRIAILAEPERYYGGYADEWTGGANALFAAGHEAARVRRLRSDLIVLGGPEDFGFVRDSSDESVCAWRRKRVIDVEAVGFSLSDWDAPRQLASRYDVTDELLDFEHLASGWHASGCWFGVAIILIGLTDPPVIIPMGSVFQQPVMNTHVQNLATAKATKITVQAGAMVPIVLPAFCLNQSFSPPNGPVAPTSLVYTAASGSQGSVWSGIFDRYTGQP